MTTEPAARRTGANPPNVVRARSGPAHYAALLTPRALSAAGLPLQRDVGLRVTQAIAVARAARRPGRSRMRGLIARPGGRLAWQSIPAPELTGPEAAVVRPLAVATCDLDRAMMLGRTPFPLPLHLGHECVAEVTEVGEAVTSVRVGDRVVVPFQISCGRCPACRTGYTGSCRTVPPTAMYGFGLGGGLWGGALGDLLAVPYADAMLVPLPPGVDPASAAGVGDNICDAYRQIAPHLPRLLAADPATEVLIVGRLDDHNPLTSSTPLYAAQIARALGARNVSVVDGRAAVRKRATLLDIQPLEPRRHRSWPTASLTVDSTGTPQGLRRVLAHTAPDGTCTCVWSLHRRAGIPLAASYVRNVTLHIGRSHVRTVMPEVLDLMATGRIQPELVTTLTTTFDRAPRALAEHCHDDAIKTVLTN
ncbi:alcohol dehydrogenase catalytic domain-containing protein [Nocardia jinanensis]|uniref:Alcohol dehydrogenase n=1 Tax=Nocardia jinanensis TaxID=382504 RepID=A0A917VMU9_9NOCA|nr:alcohol dehydrogenase catalytic domain-containing protein [Nocardia jinanensis]GGK97184.1 alcohol dehydrogenase [Nocardia jinanensis]